MTTYLVAMLAAIHFDSTVDVTGMATVLLALATAVLALSTRKAARATQKDVDLTRRQLDAQHRPLVLPTGIGMDGLDAKNTGSGPALNARVDVRLKGSKELKCITANANPIEISGELRTRTELGLFQFCERVVWTYEDLTGKRYQTAAELIDDQATGHRCWGKVTAITV